MLYLYAIIDQSAALTFAEPGLVDAEEPETRPYSLSYKDIAAVVGPITTCSVAPTAANVWRHEAIVEALMADRAVLPVRFGTVLTDQAAVEAALMAHYADFVAGLSRVRGRVELGLRVLWDGEWQIADSRWQIADGGQQPTASSGRAYLLARLEEERQTRAWRQQAEVLAAEVHAPLARLATESTQEMLVTPRLLLTAAYLVDRGQVSAFQQEVEGLAAAHPALRFLCTGPWPPYSFVTATVAEG